MKILSGTKQEAGHERINQTTLPSKQLGGGGIANDGKRS
jgi:hypothetical protein